MTPLIRRGLIADSSVRPGDAPLTPAIAVAGARRRLIRFAGIGIAAYAVAMIATIPAGAVIGAAPWRTGVAGTIWNGEAGIAGGSVLKWSWAPLRSLVSLGYAADWRASGGSADLGGRALVRPGRLVIDSMSGAAPASILTAIQPTLPFTCDLVMQVEFPRAVLGGSGQMVEGNLTTDLGTCQPKAGGAPTTVPPLILTAEHIGTESRLRLAPATQRRRTLMTIVLSEDGNVTATMTPAGTIALPFVGLPPGGSVQGQI